MEAPARLQFLVFCVQCVALTTTTAVTSFGNNEVVVIDVSSSQSVQISIMANSTLAVEAINFSQNVTSIIFGAHTQFDNIALSLSKHLLANNSITGTNIGLTHLIKESQSSATAWLINANSQNVTLLLYLAVHYTEDPIPGGCNMEFPIEISPYLLLFDDKLSTVLEFQHANIGSRKGKPPLSCSQAINYLGYDIFVLYLSENSYSREEYFDGIKTMSNAKHIRAEARSVKNSVSHPDTKVVFLKYPRIGAVYNVIAKYTYHGIVHEAAYVPSATYGCQLTSEGLNCGFPFTSATKPTLIILSVFGLLTALFGHKCFTFEMFFIGFCGTLFVSFILISKYGKQLSDQNALLASAAVAVAGGTLSALMWVCFQHPVIAVIPVGLVSGVLISSVLLFTPLGDFEIFINDKVYWMFISCVCLLSAIFSVLFPKAMSIASSSLIGSYMAILIVDYLLGSNLLFIVFNVVKKALANHAVFIAVSAFPFQKNDEITCTSWALLFVFSIVFQVYINRKGPKFQRPCTPSFRVMRLVREYYRQHTSRNQQNATSPLLVNDRQGYQTFT